VPDYDPAFAGEIFKGIYRLGPERARINIYVVDCGGEYVMMDTGPTNSLDGIRRQMAHLGIPVGGIKFIIVSHCHADHVGTLAAMKRRTKAKVIAHAADALPIEKGDVIRTWTSMVPYQGFFAACKVDVKVQDHHVLNVGSREFVITHFHSHTSGSLCVEFKAPEGRIVMLGDVLYKDGGMGFLDFHNEASIPMYIENLERLKERNPDYVLPGHGIWYRFSKRIANRALKRLRFYADQPEFGTADSRYMTKNNWRVPQE